MKIRSVYPNFRSKKLLPPIHQRIAQGTGTAHGATSCTTRRGRGKAIDPQLSGLAQRTPWQWVNTGVTTQALLGGTWTHQSQFSVLAEA